MRFVVFVLLMVVAVAFGAEAARDGVPEQGGVEERLTFDPNVLRIQKALASVEYYSGPLDGQLTQATIDAIRAYQRKRGFVPDGIPSANMADSLEAWIKATALKEQMERTRAEQKAAAREALLSDPATRDLLQGGDGETADPTRDPSACFKAPSVGCLLMEAAESSKAVYQDEKRDWALGELLTAQAKAGLTDEAMTTVRRIRDPRLIVVALRDIAVAHAEAGRNQEAVKTAGLIPDPLNRAEALAAIAASNAASGKFDQAREILKSIDAALEELPASARNVGLRAEAAVLLTKHGDTTAAADHLTRAREMAQSMTKDKSAALRYLATALVNLGRVEEALSMVKSLDTDSDRTSVLVAATNYFLGKDDRAKALATAKKIEQPRYKAVAFCSVAKAQADSGDMDLALNILSAAEETAKDITAPSARDFAYSRLALTKAHLFTIAHTSKLNLQAIQATQKISSTQVRAESLWSISSIWRKAGDTATAALAANQAAIATKTVKSSLSRVWLQGNLALDHLKAGDGEQARAAFTRAKDEAATITHPWSRTRALAQLSIVLIELTKQP